MKAEDKQKLKTEQNFLYFNSLLDIQRHHRHAIPNVSLEKLSQSTLDFVLNGEQGASKNRKNLKGISRTSLEQHQITVETLIAPEITGREDKPGLTNNNYSDR